jgi:hypothetical protein
VKAHPNITEDDVQRMLQRQVTALIFKANALGYVVTIELQPDVPRRMGGYFMVGDVRRRRAAPARAT